MIVADTVNELWLTALDVCYEGDYVAPRGQGVREERGITLVLHESRSNVLTLPERKLNYHFLVAEWLWMLHGLNDVRTIAAYNSKIAKFSDDGEVFFGAYGPKLARDLQHVIELLQRDPDTRQAVIEIWNPAALTTLTKDVPCTLTWQFFVRNRQLELHVNMRSNDVWLGFPYDVFNFTQMQRYVASQLDIKAGAYFHHVGSLHLYEQHVEPAENLLQHYDARDNAHPTIAPEPRWPVPPEVGRILRGLPRGDSAETARAQLRQLEPEWREYAGVLLHRFSKEHADLGPYFRGLIK